MYAIIDEAGKQFKVVKGKKVDIIKYKRRKGYHKHIGHRQKYLRVRITGIQV